MHNSYYVSNGIAYITESSSLVSKRAVHSCLKKELMAENTIEQIDNEIEITKDDIAFNDELAKDYRFWGLYGASIIAFTGVILPFVVNYIMNGTIGFPAIDPASKGMFFLKVANGIAVFSAACDSIPRLSGKIKCKKVKRGLNNRLKNLKRDKTLALEYCESLNEIKTDIKVRNNEGCILDNKSLERELYEYYQMYYDIAYNQEKYLRYLENGKIEQKLEKKYSDESVVEEGIRQIKNKARVLSKK